jgi:hypothetical protein
VVKDYPEGRPVLTSQSALRLSLHHLSLGLLPQVPEELFLLGVVRAVLDVRA